MDTETKNMSDTFSKFVNDYAYSRRVHKLVECLSNEHRTLQQCVTKFCVLWLERCAKMHEDRDFDLRNEASVKLGKVFVERIPEQDRALPFI